MQITSYILIICIIFLGCVVPSEPPQDTFRISLLASDTISPYQAIKFSLSSLIEDSQTVSFQFQPMFIEYHTIVTSTRDTIELIPSAPFEGNTRYTLIPKFLNSSVDISTDSLIFHTFAHEREPNNTTETADLLSGRIFGSISNINDTDYFTIKTRITGFHLTSYYSQSVFSISDSAGKQIPKREYSSPDSISIPDSFKYPLQLKVHSYLRSSGGYYEIGSFTK